MKKIILLLVSYTLYPTPYALFAQTKVETEVRVLLRDGSSFSGKTVMGNVILVTAYGRLDIPLEHVTAMDMGITPDKSNENKIINLIKQMANSSADMRKSAYEELTKLNIGDIQIISDFIYSEKYVAAEFTDFTPEAALIELKASLNIDDSVSDKDVITIDGEYTMGGTYDFKKIDLKTEYGTLLLPKEKIEHMDVFYGGSERAFVLLGNKHISANVNGGWFRTGIILKRGQKISIHASGEIMLASLSNSKYKPDGTISGTVSGGSTEEKDENDYAVSSGSTYPIYGNVVYKIGESGTMMKAGAKFNGNAKGAGILYISVYETVYNTANTGSYLVKISVK
ncbi:MAG: hypothetical protein EPN85_04125 [Bacteroidetes bacterium]|nr:MAG: hypothetical protein EPN85_04125 [Bacteroidota bacterium]